MRLSVAIPVAVNTSVVPDVSVIDSVYMKFDSDKAIVRVAPVPEIAATGKYRIGIGASGMVGLFDRSL
jgi:hypothetical protein